MDRQGTCRSTGLRSKSIRSMIQRLQQSAGTSSRERRCASSTLVVKAHTTFPPFLDPDAPKPQATHALAAAGLEKAVLDCAVPLDVVADPAEAAQQDVPTTTDQTERAPLLEFREELDRVVEPVPDHGGPGRNAGTASGASRARIASELAACGS